MAKANTASAVLLFGLSEKLAGTAKANYHIPNSLPCSNPGKTLSFSALFFNLAYRLGPYHKRRARCQ